MTRQQFKALPLKEQIKYRASGSMGYPAPSTNAEISALDELIKEGVIVFAGYPQNSTTARYKLKSQ